MAKVPNGVETLPKISIAWVGCTNVTDRRQTDDRRQTTDRRQTDGRWHIANVNASSRSLKTIKNNKIIEKNWTSVRLHITVQNRVLFDVLTTLFNCEISIKITSRRAECIINRTTVITFARDNQHCILCLRTWKQSLTVWFTSLSTHERKQFLVNF